MKTILILSLMLFVSSAAFAEDDYMFFSVNQIALDKDGLNENVLVGQTVASRIYVMIDDNEFEIMGTRQDPITAETYLTTKRLYFIKDEIKFSTTLDSTNILYDIESLRAEDADIELSKDHILIEGSMLEALMADTNFLIENISMRCLTNEFTTDIDIACLKNVDISALEGDSGIVKVSDQKEGSYEINVRTDKLRIQDSEIFVSAKNLLGTYADATFSIQDGTVKCFKDPELSDLDPQLIINGCLTYSSLQGAQVSYKKSALNVTIDKGLIGTDEGGLTVASKYAVFRNADGNTTVDNFNFKCGKLDIDINNPNPYAITNGCLNSSKLTISHFRNDAKNLELYSDKGLIDINDFKNLSLNIKNNKFTLKTKVKVIARISIRINGSITLNELKEEMVINISKASIAGISARSLALYIIESFLDGDSIRVQDQKIIIKL